MTGWRNPAGGWPRRIIPYRGSTRSAADDRPGERSTGPGPRPSRGSAGRSPLESARTHCTHAHEELRLPIRRFLEREVVPHLEEWEETTFPDAIMKRFGELGLLGLRYPPEYGGQGGDYFSAVVLSEEMARAHCGGPGQGGCGHGEVGAPPVFKFGTEEQKHR